MAMFESSEKKKEAEKSVESLNRASLFNYSFARSMKDANRGQSAARRIVSNGNETNRSTYEQTNHRAVMTFESDASGERGGKRAQAPLNRGHSFQLRVVSLPCLLPLFSPQVLEDVAPMQPEANGQRKTEAPLTPRTLTRCVVFIPTTRY